MRPKLLILDMDGTLADTSPGILDSYRHVADYLGVPVPDDEEMFSRMGGSLPENLARIYGLDAEGARLATDAYRVHYGREGFLKAVPYDGMRELLEAMRAEGIPVAIATMKLEEYARRQVEHWGLSGFFVSVNGSNALDDFSKSDLIDRALYSAGVGPGEALMVGDTLNDMMGAAESGVPFMAVTYGYGFTKGICEEHGIDYAVSPQDVMRKVLSA